MLELVATLVQTIEIEAYSRFESIAREHMRNESEQGKKLPEGSFTAPRTAVKGD